MADESFETNILRWIAATLYFSAGMQAAREIHGKSYFSLGVGEKAAVDQLVLNSVAGNYQALTPELLTTQKNQPVGFQTPAGAKS